METMLKTTDVCKRVGVNSTTVKRWVTHFNLTLKTNDKGHYLYSPKQVELFLEIKKHLRAGQKMKDLTVEGDKVVAVHKESPKKEMIPKALYEKKLENLTMQIDLLERKLSEKADEVVSFQVLRHRTEIDDMMKTLQKIEERVSTIEQQVHQDIEANKEPERQLFEQPRSVKRALVKMFSF
ncbi:MerR family transcriptional regulator [Desertibacillus haloalkaliphilus]|uniref:MerR family transcriptional regulator n=1 Tax=Desertibacillus haloalkaliphilus TaxID=1328930 RepID=UPI001C2747C7|nr:MerR family transcriptional regulator [Desertibacillus haloalkaliphilus]MBU8907296.1 MerR family transcriptional regulator [Desertibacillus haloalkaliphilus]